MAKVFIEETTLTNIGNAIRDKEGSSALIPVTDMATRIAAIESGGGGAEVTELSITSNGTYTAPEGIGYSPVIVNVPQDGSPPESAFSIEGNSMYMFAYNCWNWFIEQYGNKITTSGLNSTLNMFQQSTELKNIPFQLNLSTASSLSRTFSNCQRLTICPKIRGTFVATSYSRPDISDIVESCQRIRDFEDLFDPSMFDPVNSIAVTSSYSCPRYPNFKSCSSLRNVPSWYYRCTYPADSTAYPSPSYSTGYYTFSDCFALDEVIDFPTPVCNAEQTSNIWQYFVTKCYRLKNFTFATDNGTPYVVKWKSQILDFSNYVGYPESNTDFYKKYITTYYNSGITTDKEVSDDATYQALKNDPDWYTGLREYSRYNHDSAVATINSLPDTSAYLATAGGTNTIKFKGDAGSATDGGAINTLTEEEIAVAAAKGWTVTIA